MPLKKHEPLIRTFTTKFTIILQEAATDRRLVDLSMSFIYLTADTIMNYTFQKPLGALDTHDFDFPLLRAIGAFMAITQWYTHMPGTVDALSNIIETVPVWLVRSEPLALVKCVVRVRLPLSERSFFNRCEVGKQTCKDRIITLKNQPALAQRHKVFNTTLHPNAFKGQVTPSVDDFSKDAFFLFLAGTDNTTHTLELAVFNILNNPVIHQKLNAELREAMPGRSFTLKSRALEKLPICFLSQIGGVSGRQTWQLKEIGNLTCVKHAGLHVFTPASQLQNGYLAVFKKWVSEREATRMQR